MSHKIDQLSRDITKEIEDLDKENEVQDNTEQDNEVYISILISMNFIFTTFTENDRDINGARKG